jgi:DNA mismatch repair protein MutS
MTFHSILHPRAVDSAALRALEAPECFHDLRLDQIVRSVCEGRDEYDLAPFFHVALDDLDAIAYRQEVMRDLESEDTARAIESFSDGMRSMRRTLPEDAKHYHSYEKERLFLAAVTAYCDAVERLAGELDRLRPASRGVCALRDHLSRHAASSGFSGMAGEARRLRAALGAVRYGLLLKDDVVTVRRYEDERDYSAVVEETFEKFRRGAVEDYRSSLRDAGRMNHIEGQILERVARLHPDVFRELAAFCADHADYADELVLRFDREVQFYLAWLAHLRKLRAAGLKFCYPRLSRASKEVESRESFDLALAAKLVGEGAAVVTNDFRLGGAERVIVVTGPNQGGKTTFARTFGQLHFLSRLGCPVPGTQARLFLCDRVFCHFERQEDVATLRGQLKDDLVRIHRILEHATPRSVVVMNEVFSSTALEDALFLSRKVMARLSDLDLLGVCVTFLDELATFDGKTVSMVSGVAADDPARRTYRIERRPADGLAYALALARKHRVTYDWLKERIRA